MSISANGGQTPRLPNKKNLGGIYGGQGDFKAAEFQKRACMLRFGFGVESSLSGGTFGTAMCEVLVVSPSKVRAARKRQSCETHNLNVGQVKTIQCAPHNARMEHA